MVRTVYVLEGNQLLGGEDNPEFRWWVRATARPNRITVVYQPRPLGTLVFRKVEFNKGQSNLGLQAQSVL